jgi:hypothetical protein
MDGIRHPLLFGAMTCLVAVRHRKLATSPDRPEQYLPRYYRLLQNDSGSITSKFVRHVHLFLKKGVLCHYVLIFSVLALCRCSSAWQSLEAI